MTLFRSEGANYDETAGQGTLPSDVRRGYVGLFSSTGVLPSSDSPLVEGAGDFTYTVHTGYWVTSRGGSDGFHYWGNVGDLSVATGVAPAAGLSRIDIIYALHPSNTENADTTSAPKVAVASGTAASNPIPPVLPTGALELGRNEMTSTATSTASSGNTIAQTFPWTAVKGTPVQVRSASERDTGFFGVMPASTSNPIRVWRIDLNREEVNYGAGWTATGLWSTLPLASGWTAAYSSALPEFRLVDDMWELRGAAYFAAGVTTTVSNLTTGGTPTPASYATNHVLVAGLSPAGNRFAVLNPRPDGGIRIYASAAGGTLVVLDGLTFRAA